MGVLMQAFFWDCPAVTGREGSWWTHVESRISALRGAGVTALWLPPAHKAANLGGPSMGYDPYDYYDFGDVQQKGRTRTWFGNEAELRSLVTTAHDNHIDVYADMVLNHNNGADAAEVNPIDGTSRWTRFTPGSGSFPRDWRSFHPSPFEIRDPGTFGGMPDLCHRDPDVYAQIVRLARYMVEDIGFDGFRFDFVKGFGPWLVTALADIRYLGRSADGFSPFCVGECWDSDVAIAQWLQSVNTTCDNPVSAFDFPLHYLLKGLCDDPGFDLTSLARPDTVTFSQPARSVTFVDNHDTARDPDSAIINDKMLAYAFILTHEGYPSIFWQDYHDHDLHRSGTPHGIDALIAVHERLAGGGTDVLRAGQDLYIMQRRGTATQPGLVFTLNNGGSWAGGDVVTPWSDRTLRPVAWDGRDQNEPGPVHTSGTGAGTFWASPRGFAAYSPEI